MMKVINNVSLVLISALLLSCGAGGDGDENESETETVNSGGSYMENQDASISALSLDLVSVSSLSAGELTLDWLVQGRVNNAGVSGLSQSITNISDLVFAIHVSKEKHFVPDDDNKVAQVTGKDTTVVSGLASATQYFVKISTMLNGNLVWSNELSAQTVAVTLKLSTNRVHVQEASNTPEVVDNEIVYRTTNTPEVGSILVSDQGEGYLRKVKSATQQADGTSKVVTEAAALNDVFEDLEFSTVIKSTPISAVQSNSNQTPARSLQSNSSRTGFNANSHTWASGLTLTYSPHSPRNILANSNRSAYARLAVSDHKQVNKEDYYQLEGPVNVFVKPNQTSQFSITARQIKAYKQTLDICQFDIEEITHPNKKDQSKITFVTDGEVTETTDQAITKHFTIAPKNTDVDNDYKPYSVGIRLRVNSQGDCDDSRDVDNIKLDIPIYITTGDIALPHAIATRFQSSLTVDHVLTTQYRPEIKVSTKIQDSALAAAEIILKGDYHFDQDYTIKGSAGATIDIERTVVEPIQFVKVFAAGNVPLVVKGDLRLRVAVEGKVDGEVNLNQHLAMIFDNSEFGFRYNLETKSFDPIKNLQKEYKFTIDGESQAKADLTIRVIPDLKIGFYDAASARLRLEPYVTGEVGVDGHFKYLNDGKNNHLESDYHFDSLSLRAGLDVYLFADLRIFGEDLPAWPEVNDIDKALDMADGAFDEKLFKVFHAIDDEKDGAKEVEILGIPSLTLSCDFITKPDVDSDSRSISCQGSQAEVSNPFGGQPIIRFDAWDNAQITNSDLTDKIDYAIGMVDDETGQFAFTPYKAKAPTYAYEIQIVGHSRLGSYIRQVANTNLTLLDSNNNQVLDYWEERYQIDDINADKDRDSFSNLAEYEAGSDPNNAESTPKIPPDLNNLTGVQRLIQNQPVLLTLQNTGGITTRCASAPFLPSGLNISVDNGFCQIAGTPDTTQSETTYTITAGNAYGEDTATVHITISVNHPPVAIAQKVYATEQTDKTITLFGMDPNGTNPTVFKITSLPSDGQLEDANGKIVSVSPPHTVEGSLIYTSTSDSASTDSFAFKASDGLLESAEATITIEISNVNDPPVVQKAITTQTAIHNKDFSFTCPKDTFHDKDANDTLSYTATLENGNPLPAWLNFDAASCTFLSETTSLDATTIKVKLIATDNGKDSVSNIFTLIVLPQLSITDVQIIEGNSGQKDVEVKVDLSAYLNPVSVDYATTNVSATAGSDYTAATGSLNYTGGRASQTITIAILGDTLPEAHETFNVKLSNPVNAMLGSPSVATVTITDNDSRPLNDTGLIWGGNYPYGNNKDCSGETVSQQDCSHGRDAQAVAGTLQKEKVGGGHGGFDYTRLNSDGSEYTGNGDYNIDPWACVKDNVTGLIWEVKAKNNTYRWGGIGADTHGSEHYNDWDVLVEGSNNRKLCDYVDWRVPSKYELEGLVNFDRQMPAIDIAYFPNTQSYGYWSSSANADNTTDAWYVNFNSGYSNNYYRGNSRHVRLVRGGQ